MKLLLTAINSKYIHSNLAVYSLKAYCAEHAKQRGLGNLGDTVEIAEFTINQYTQDIYREIYKKHPDIVAFSCYIWNIDYVYEVCRELKKIRQDLIIWLGGPEVTYDSQKVLREHPYIEGVMIGEGEETFLDVVRFYNHSGNEQKGIEIISSLNEVAGISYRKEDGQVVTTAMRPLLDMDELPFIYDDMRKFENKIIYYESSRGCPYGCSYCLSSVEKSVRFRSIDKVEQELGFFLSHKVAQVKFVDRTFNCSHERTKELLKFLHEHDNGITNFHFEIAADLLTDEEIDLMEDMRPGLIQLEIGVQSTNTDTIEEIDRVMDFGRLSEVVNRINSFENIHQHLDLIAGLPYENYESFTRSFDDVYRLCPEQLQLGFLKVLKGSKMARKAGDYGIEFTAKAPYEVLFTNWISYDDVLAIKNVEEVVELYYNSGQYAYTMKELLEEFDGPFAMYKALAHYYESNGLFDVKHSRITRYTILMDFIRSLKNVDTKKYEQILLFDLYLRENLKTCPSFADDCAEYKKSFRKLYTSFSPNKATHIQAFDCNLVELCGAEAEIIDIGSVKAEDEFLSSTKKELIMFDYAQRNPLNYAAKAYILK